MIIYKTLSHQQNKNHYRYFTNLTLDIMRYLGWDGETDTQGNFLRSLDIERIYVKSYENTGEFSVKFKLRPGYSSSNMSVILDACSLTNYDLFKITIGPKETIDFQIWLDPKLKNK
jgi:hypothetical protein